MSASRANWLVDALRPSGASSFDGLLRRLPDQAYGVFSPPRDGELGGLERADARATIARAWARWRDAQSDLHEAELELRHAVAVCVKAGAAKKQMARLLDVSRPTIYAWLDQAEGE